jgi:hypothetical protein
VGTYLHLPFLHFCEQQAMPTRLMHGLPFFRQPQAPPLHVPEQHFLSRLHGVPGA